jgi:hypothetical protein
MDAPSPIEPAPSTYLDILGCLEDRPAPEIALMIIPARARTPYGQSD